MGLDRSDIAEYERHEMEAMIIIIRTGPGFMAEIYTLTDGFGGPREIFVTRQRSKISRGFFWYSESVQIIKIGRLIHVKRPLESDICL